MDEVEKKTNKSQTEYMEIDECVHKDKSDFKDKPVVKDKNFKGGYYDFFYPLFNCNYNFGLSQLP